MPLITRTLHLPHVPRAPQVESMGRPSECAALNSVVPGGTRVVRSKGTYVTSSFLWITTESPRELRGFAASSRGPRFGRCALRAPGQRQVGAVGRDPAHRVLVVAQQQVAGEDRTLHLGLQGVGDRPLRPGVHPPGRD